MKSEKLFSLLFVATVGIFEIEASLTSGVTVKNVTEDELCEKIEAHTKKVKQLRDEGKEYSRPMETVNGACGGNLPYEELAEYLKIVLKKVEGEGVAEIIGLFLSGDLDELLQGCFTDADLGSSELLLRLKEILRRAEDRDYAYGFSCDDWRIHWAVALLYAADFKGLSEDVRVKIKRIYDGYDE